MIIREANIEDIQQIQIVRNSVKENTLSDPNLVTDKDCEEFLLLRGKGWVCVMDNQIVGFAIVDLKENNVWALFVNPKFEGIGIGKQLHKTMLDWYFSQTNKTIWLGTEFNTRAEKFYRTAGWHEVGTNGSKEIKFEMTFDQWASGNMENNDQHQLNQPMEVHHHAGHGGKKNWKSYIWEFLMLFLAVFCGFLAEYQLEHVIEHGREKQFMVSLVEDLESDTIELKQAIQVCESVARYTDSVLIYMATHTIGKEVPANFDEMVGFAGQRQIQIHTDRTAIQLKNSGSMRLIRNKQVSDSILRYWKSIDAAKVSLDRYMIYREAGRVISLQLWVSQLVYLNGRLVPEKELTSLRVIDNNQKKWDEMANLLATSSMITRNVHKNNLLDQLNRAKQLIALIKTVYQLN